MTAADTANAAASGTNPEEGDPGAPPHDALHALELEDERLARRIAELESIIADASLGVVRRTKAKVELALLKTDEHASNKQREELAAIRDAGGVRTTKRMVEQDIKSHEDRLASEAAIRDHMADLHQQALIRQKEARLRAEEAQLRSAEAEALLREAEREAEMAMAAARAAMAKLNEARENARRQRLLLEEARGIEESLLEEMERMNQTGEGGEKDNRGGTLEGKVKAGIEHIEKQEGKASGKPLDESVKSFDDEFNSMKAVFDDRRKILKADADKALVEEVARLKAAVKELQHANKRQRGRILSLEDHVSHSGERQKYYQEQSEKLSRDLTGATKQKEELERKIEELRVRAGREDIQVENLRSEINDLRTMKSELETRLYLAEDLEKLKLRQLVDEIDQLIADKNRALEEVEAVQAKYQRTIAEREATIRELTQDVELIHEELNRAHELLDEQDERTAAAAVVPAAVPPPQAKAEAAEVREEKALDLDPQTEALLKAQIDVQEREIANLAKQVARYKEQVSELEEANFDQWGQIKKLTKQANKSKGMKEAFMMQDQEIQRLKTSLAIEAEKSAKLAFDVKHWRNSAADLSKSLVVVQQKRDETQEDMDDMQNRLSKRVVKLQQELAETKRAIKLKESKVIGLEASAQLQDAIFSRKLEQKDAALRIQKRKSQSNDEEDDLPPDIDKLDSDDLSIDSALEEKVDNSALEEILGRVLAERDRLAQENEELLNTRKGSSPRSTASSNKRSDRDEITASRSLDRDEETKSKKESSRKTQVYQLSLRDGESGLQYIGKTKGELDSQVKKHYQQVWEMVQMENDMAAESKHEEGEEDADDFMHSSFAKHFARHCRNAQSEEEVINWCAANMKMAKQKIRDDEEEDDCFIARTVYQLSCKDERCSNMHYIGSTLDDLERRVFKHYGEVWKVVEEEYGEKGFCKDAADNSMVMGEFGSTAAHFAKHCRRATSKSEVRKWCQDNIKVEKWTMVCKNCLGTQIETPNIRNSIVSFKTESRITDYP